jgi:[citrate (pro-3S)-lyase] ligase
MMHTFQNTCEMTPQELLEDIRRYRPLWLQNMPPQFSRPLFSQLPHYSSEYLKWIFSGPGNIVKNGVIANADYSNPYVTVKNGRRHTVEQLSKYRNVIHMFGHSVVYGFGAEDAHTIPSYLQKMLNAGGGGYKVNNNGVRGNPLWNRLLQFQQLNFHYYDIVFIFTNSMINNAEGSIIELLHRKCVERGVYFGVFFYPRLNEVTNPSQNELLLQRHTYQDLCANNLHEVKTQSPTRYSYPKLTSFCQANGIAHFDLQHVFNRPHDMGEIFFDKSHWTFKGNERCAEFLYKLVVAIPKDHPDDIAVENQCVCYLIDFVKAQYCTKEVIKWINSVKNKRFETHKRIGAIVMNANPFTNGHKYLIEKALQEVEVLYVFVVQEDSSFFSFSDRIRLVKDGSREFGPRVQVVPSGKFIISSFTFPEYFTKELKPMAADSSLDILIFGSIIAPALQITHRFVGEEPHDPVTESYNQTMGKYLPAMGITLRVVPRTQTGGKGISAVISANRVRTLLKTQNFEAIAKLVPKTTLRYLKKESYGLSKSQKLIFRLICPVVKKLTNAKNFHRFQKNPAAFFNSLKSRKYRIFGKIFFPLP